jgi:hypothetical protein
LTAPCGGQPPRSAVTSGAGGGALRYRAVHADAADWGRVHRPKPCKLAGNACLCREISAKLIRKWSVQQIAGWRMREHPDDDASRVSHETICRRLFIQTRGVLKKKLLAHLRATRAIRRFRHATLKRCGLGPIRDMVSIRERPAAVEDRAGPGHWPCGDAAITCRLTGERSDCRLGQQLHCHAGRAAFPLCDVGTRWRQGQPQLSLRPSSSNRKNRRRNSNNPSLRTAARRCPGIKNSRWRRTSMSSSVTRTAHGNAALTKTPTDCCGNTFQKAPIFRYIANPS